MKNAILLSACFVTTSALAAAPASLSFTHEDWEIACDNTRTCRAAGYQQDGEEPAVSVLLVRKAGPREPIVAKVQLGSYDEEARQAMPDKLALRIGSRALGMVALDKDWIGQLSRPQAEALVTALAGRSVLSWSGAGKTWTLSGKGAAAVLLKMDEFQGRLGTAGAALRKGGKPEEGVLPPLAPPVVQAVPVPKAAPRAAGKEERRQLLASLRRFEGDDCGDLAIVASEGLDVMVTPLSGGKQLVSARCWMGAYNVGEGYWVTNPKPPYDPVLVTASGSDYDKGRISAAHKGRGLGDCWGSDEWVWDGRRFAHTASATTGMCRLVAAGGAWELPTLVSEVRE
ncbi:DUF1176 domain-containing protein [Massilia sp. DD77]|uniref:DUF1176 domain-containing protein n=1 Tax=Massilia sp. DD77 TaxID=3109349 RepID=UPI002FFDF8F3